MTARPVLLAQICCAIGQFFSRDGGPRAAAIAIMLVVTSGAVAAAIHTISQRNRDFSLAQISIARGDTLRFTNDDEFLHQIYLDSKDLKFDSDEQRPGQTIEVNFPHPGTYAVRCHIHPKMLLTVEVR